MFHFLRERRTLFLLAAVMATLFVLMAIQVRQDAPVESEGYLLRLVSPILRGVSSLTGGVGGVWDEYVNLRGTRARNTALTDKVTTLTMELQKLEEARIQNERLRTLLDLKEGMGVPTVAATVIGNQSTGLSHTILLDRGSSAGIRPNMPVVSAQGVVGRVWTVAPGVSKIQLITDSAAGTAVLVQRTRVQGVLIGRGTGLCSLEYVSALEDVKERDLLVTSGLEGIYPKGLPIAEVVGVGGQEGFLKEIKALPRVEFNKLEEVLILMSRNLPSAQGEAEAP